MSEHQGSEFGTAMSGLVGILILVALVYTFTAAQFSGDSATETPEQIAARIAPVGSVTLAGSEAAAPAAAPKTASVPTDEGPGGSVYNKACTACHASGAAGAPKLGDKAAWESRIAQGVDQLLQTAINGKGAMPPRGTCMDCSDDDLMAAIEYMLVQVGYEPAASADTGSPEKAEGTSGIAGTPEVGGMSGMPGMAGESAAPSPTDTPMGMDGSSGEGTHGMQGESTPESQSGLQ
jgi:cytochrome c5